MQAQGTWTSAAVRELAGVLGWARLVSGFVHVHGHSELHICKEPRGSLEGSFCSLPFSAQSAESSLSARKEGSCSDRSDPGGSLKGRRFS